MTNTQRKVMFSSKSDLWETPQDFFDNLDKEFHFTLDACALPENAKCQKYYTPEDDGLLQPWSGVVWCNPPYSECAEWAKKCYEESRGGNTVVFLVPSRTDTKWFHQYVYPYAEIRFVKGRLKFGNSKNSAPFPSMVCIFRPTSQTNIAEGD